MSGSLAFDTAEFADAEKADIRRFCGYPAFGGAQAVSSWRFFQHYGALEYRLNNLSGAERQITRMMLATLSSLEADLAACSGNLDTAGAAAWKHNPNEVVDRTRLMTSWGQRLASHLGIPYADNLRTSSIVI